MSTYSAYELECEELEDATMELFTSLFDEIGMDTLLLVIFPIREDVLKPKLKLSKNFFKFLTDIFY